MADVDGEVAVGAFILAPLGEVDVEVGFGGFFEEFAEAVFAVGLPLLKQVQGEDELPLQVGDGDQGDDGVRAVTARVLKRAGYNVRAVTGGEEALEFAESHRGEIHLLVTDVAMPDIDGFEVARRLQRLRPGLRVLTMSGYPAAAIESRMRGADFGPLLRKPFMFQALLDAVRAALDGPARPPADD